MMGFIRKAAKYGLFGLTGLEATGAFKDKKKEKPQPMLETVRPPSLLSDTKTY